VLSPGSEIAGAQQTDLFTTLSAAASGLNDLSQTGVAPVLANLNQRITDVAEDVLRFRREELSPFLARLDVRVNQDLTGQAEAVLARLDASAARLQVMLGPDNERRVTDFLVHLDEVAVNLNELVTRIEDTRARMQDVLNSLGALVDDNDEDVRAAVVSARAALGDMEATLDSVNERIDTVMYNLDGSSRQMHELTRALRENPARILRGSPGVDEGAVQ
jgi:phospholipid/cholesterol/gamma-HCH transport system substrate-binding protein